MRFVVDRTKRIIDSVLVYRERDYAFALEPRPRGADAALSVNELQLMVDTGDHRVIFVAGYCPYQKWRAARLQVPGFVRAVLLVEEIELREGASTQLNARDDRWPVTVDIETGWVCLGDTGAIGEAIEFAPYSVAMLADGQLVALWLQPRGIPTTLIPRSS